MRKICVLFAILLMVGHSYGQPNSLSTKVSFKGETMLLEKAIEHIADRANVLFSYNVELLPKGKQVTLPDGETTVHELLIDLLGTSCSFQEVGTHIVLVVASSDNSDTTFDEFVVAKEQHNSFDSDHVPFDAIDPFGNDSPKIDIIPNSYEYGYTSELADGAILYVSVCVDEQGNITRTFTRSNQAEYVALQNKEASMYPTNIYELKSVDFFLSDRNQMESSPFSTKMLRLAQVSLWPRISTNGVYSGSYTNVFSFNVFSGYAAGVNGFELGGVLNIIRRDVYGFQIGGFGNVVGEDVSGWQIAGFFNHIGGHANGWIVAGFTNRIIGDLQGVQLSGFQNTLVGKMNGVQISGFGNIAPKEVTGIQIAGFFNQAKQGVKSIQIAGALNHSKGVNGLQLSGLSNSTTGTNQGLQLAGLFNYADTLQGVQFGIVNYANHKEKGKQYGLVNICKGGISEVEYAFDPILVSSFAYRFGNRRFYSSAKLGLGFDHTVGLGLGFGFVKPLKEKNSLDCNFQYTYLFDTNNRFEHVGQTWKFGVNYQQKVAERVTVFVGPELAYYLRPNDESTKGLFHPILEFGNSVRTNAVLPSFCLGLRMSLARG